MIMKTTDLENFLQSLESQHKKDDLSVIRANLPFLKKSQSAHCSFTTSSGSQIDFVKSIEEIEIWIKRKNACLKIKFDGKIEIHTEGQDSLTDLALEIHNGMLLTDIPKIIVINKDRVFSLERRKFTNHKTGWLVTNTRKMCLGYLSNVEVSEMLRKAKSKITRDEALVVYVQKREEQNDKNRSNAELQNV